MANVSPVIYALHSRAQPFQAHDLPRLAEEVQAITNPAIGVQSWEMTLELTYGCTVKPGLLVQPSLQYLVNPGGDKAVPNALALGVNVVINF